MQPTINETNKDEYYMQLAINEANKAYKAGDVPVGCVIVLNDEIIAKAHNRKEKTNNAIMHAEMIALQKAYKKIGNWRLNNAELYSTAEPCIMCAGAILHSRIKRVVFGVLENKFGGVLSRANLFDLEDLNHKVIYEYGILEKNIAEMMKKFFIDIRKNK